MIDIDQTINSVYFISKEYCTHIKQGRVMLEFFLWAIGIYIAFRIYIGWFRFKALENNQDPESKDFDSNQKLSEIVDSHKQACDETLSRFERASSNKSDTPNSKKASDHHFDGALKARLGKLLELTVRAQVFYNEKVIGSHLFKFLDHEVFVFLLALSVKNGAPKNLFGLDFVRNQCYRIYEGVHDSKYIDTIFNDLKDRQDILFLMYDNLVANLEETDWSGENSFLVKYIDSEHAWNNMENTMLPSDSVVPFSERNDHLRFLDCLER